jgi:hypothetical protein
MIRTSRIGHHQGGRRVVDHRLVEIGISCLLMPFVIGYSRVPITGQNDAAHGWAGYLNSAVRPAVVSPGP